MPQGSPKPGERYLHFKNKMYQIVCLAHHSETDERLVVYQALYGDFGICARPYDMFISEVDHEKYPDVKQKYRFTYVEADNEQPYWAKEEKQPEASEEKKEESVVEKQPEAVVEKTPLEKLLEAKPAVRMVVEPEPEKETFEFNDFKKAGIVIRENLPTEDRIHIKVEKSERREFEPVKEVPPLVVESMKLDDTPVKESATERLAATDSANTEAAEEGQANPWLIKFLDAETFDEKYEVLGQMYRDIDDKLIDDIAVCMDVVVPTGNLQERYMQLKQCLRTRQKYEGTRL